jgi:hypothetical protein
MKLSHLKDFLIDLAREKEDKTVKAASTINTYICAIKNIHKETKNAELQLNFETKGYLNEFLCGYKKLVANKKHEGAMKNHEGKMDISITVYKRLAKFALKNVNGKVSSWMHCFLVLCWNMFARYCLKIAIIL